MKKFRQPEAWWGAVPIALFLGIWEISSRLHIGSGSFIIPPFSTILTEFWYLSVSGVLGSNFLSSLTRVMIGFSTGSIAGLSIGILMGWNNAANTALNPIISLLYPIPALGWLPLLMLLLGIGEVLPIAIIFICSFFPILYNTATGIKNVDKNFIFVAKTLGVSDTRILFTVVIPLALPNIFTGLRLESGMAWRVIIAAEMVAIPTGIGALMMRAESLIRIDIIIACLLVLGVMSLSFENFFTLLERKLTHRWK